MYSGRESRIEFFNTVRCQEEDALVIFKLSKEDGDKGVSLHVFLRSFR